MKKYNRYDYDFLANEIVRKPEEYLTPSHTEIEALYICAGGKSCYTELATKFH